MGTKMDYKTSRRMGADEVEGVTSNLALYAALSKICSLCAKFCSLASINNKQIDLNLSGMDDKLDDEEKCIKNEMFEYLCRSFVQMKCLSTSVVVDSPLTPFRVHFAKNFDSILQLTFSTVTQRHMRPTKQVCAGRDNYADLHTRAENHDGRSRSIQECAAKKELNEPHRSRALTGDARSGIGLLDCDGHDCKTDDKKLGKRPRHCSEVSAAALSDAAVDANNEKDKNAVSLAKTLHASKSVPAACALIDAPLTSRFSEEFVPERVIGKGGFGKVWKARNKVDGQFYAIKRIAIPRGRNCWRLGMNPKKAGGMRHNPIERILREVKVLSGLHNHHVVGYHAAWIEFDSPTGTVEDEDDDIDSDFHKSAASENKKQAINDDSALKYGPLRVAVLPPNPPKVIVNSKSPASPSKAASQRVRSRSRCSESNKVDFFIRDPGTLSNTTPSKSSSSSSSNASTDADDADEGAGEHGGSGYDDDDEDDAADADELDKLARKKDKSSAGHRRGPNGARKKSDEPTTTGDSIVFSPDQNQSVSVEIAANKTPATVDVPTLAQGTFKSMPGSNLPSPTTKTVVVLRKPTSTNESRSGAELSDADKIDQNVFGDLALKSSLPQPRRIALCIQMELCDASLSQYIWARNFYMQCESEVQISRVCQQGIREPYIPASVFHAVVKSSNPTVAPADSKTLTASPNRSNNNTSAVPRQNSGIGMNLMHCIDVTCCLKIIRQILLGIEYIHSRGLVHRDLKPSNIFFKFDGGNGGFEPRAMIGDFGLARYISAALDVSDQQQVASTLVQQHSPVHAALPAASSGGGVHQPIRRLSVGVGTMAYASPEQLSGRSYDSKSDIFSFAIIMFEIIVPFFTAMERNKLLNELRAGRVPPAFRQQYPRLEVLLRSMLGSEPAQRPTASKILQCDVFEDKDYIISNLREKLIEAEMHIEAMEKHQQLQQSSRTSGASGRRKMSDSLLSASRSGRQLQ